MRFCSSLLSEVNSLFIFSISSFAFLSSSSESVSERFGKDESYSKVVSNFEYLLFQRFSCCHILQGKNMWHNQKEQPTGVSYVEGLYFSWKL